ncbi:DUF4139 domain-containing protein [Streptomyces sp. NPDC058872]|uniref:DUF4139 domain-containing protein n=1 Tax=Streptomyces sp. NPDC058872 TaxID=3346661 RepID=UPI0036C48D74
MIAGAAPGWGSTLDSVVVYAQGALCRRLARGVVPQDGRVRVAGLPRSLDPGSLRARVLGGSAARVTEARVEVEAEPRTAEAPGTSQQEHERLLDAYRAARARRDRQQGLIEEVTGLRPVPPARRREDPYRRTPTDAWLGLADFVEERLTRLHARLVALDEELRLAEHAVDLSADRLARASTDAPSPSVETSVCAALTLADAGDDEVEVEVEVEYGVPGAVWAPAYRLAHRQGEESGRLVLRASVAQRTGEDWTGVHIALATADLRRRTDLPALRSLRIGRRQPPPAASGWREPPAGLASLFTGYRAAGPAPEGFGVAGAVGGGVSLPVAAPGPQPAPRPPAPPPGAGGAFTGLPRSGAAYGSAPQGFEGGAPGHARSAAPRPAGRTHGGGGAPLPAAPAAPAAPVPPPPPPSGPPRPSAPELDYAGLVLSGPEEPGDRRGRLFPGSSFDAIAAEYRRRAEAVAALPLPEHAVRPSESAGSFAQRFDAAARTDVPSDGTWHTVTVGEIPVDLRAEHLCVPSVEPTVYATLAVSTSTGQALLAGPVEVSVDGEFLLTAALPTLAPGSVRRLGLGPVEGIRVTRRTHLNESTAGLRNNVTVLDHRVHVELANRLATPAEVEVHERVPVSSEPDVRIEERGDWEAPEDGAAPEHHVPGTRIWRVELPAGGTAVLEAGYEIRIPASKTLVDGNRRS